MDAEKVNNRALSPQQEDYLEVENHCCLCGSELVFQHSQDETLKKVQEKAHCPCCKVQLKDREHIIH